MPVVTVAGRRYRYKTAGDGFPLLLTSGPQGTIAEWAEVMPLLGEVCRTIAYEDSDAEQPGELLISQAGSVTAADEVTALLDILGTERAYLAAAGLAGPLALSLALHMPQYVEGLMLIGMVHGDMTWPAPTDPNATQPGQTGRAAMIDRLADITIPVLILVGDQIPSQLWQAELLAMRLPHGKSVILPGAGQAPHHEQPRQLGHAMLDFLMHCERQRNLVRGASFLL